MGPRWREQRQRPREPPPARLGDGGSALDASASAHRLKSSKASRFVHRSARRRHCAYPSKRSGSAREQSRDRRRVSVVSRGPPEGVDPAGRSDSVPQTRCRSLLASTATRWPGNGRAPAGCPDWLQTRDPQSRGQRRSSMPTGPPLLSFSRRAPKHRALPGERAARVPGWRVQPPPAAHRRTPWPSRSAHPHRRSAARASAAGTRAVARRCRPSGEPANHWSAHRAGNARQVNRRGYPEPRAPGPEAPPGLESRQERNGAVQLERAQVGPRRGRRVCPLEAAGEPPWPPAPTPSSGDVR